MMTAMSDSVNKKHERPLSPHLQVYRPQLTSVMSILHRATGYALALGTVMLVWMLVAAAAGPDAFVHFHRFTLSLWGQLMLLGWTFALFYHMCNGMRHLFWDTGRLFKIEDAYRAGYLVWLCAFALTAALWWMACPFAGAGGMSGGVLP